MPQSKIYEISVVQQHVLHSTINLCINQVKVNSKTIADTVITA